MSPMIHVLQHSPTPSWSQCRKQHYKRFLKIAYILNLISRKNLTKNKLPTEKQIEAFRTPIVAAANVRTSVTSYPRTLQKQGRLI